MSQAATTLSTILPIPTGTWDKNFGHLHIKDDILYPKGQTPYVGRDLQVRAGLFVISQVAPVLAAALITFSKKGWWERKFYWTLSRMLVFWHISVQIFGAIVHNQRGASTRVLFLAATFHLQLEYMIIALLLKATALQALIVAYIIGTIGYSIALFVEDFSLVFIFTATMGFPDFLIPVLYAYGGQWLYAIGGFGHFVQVVGVFCIVIQNYGYGAFHAITFFSTWITIGAYIAADFKAWLTRDKGQIRLETRDGPDATLPDELQHEQQGEAVDNPLRHITIPKKTLFALVAMSLIGSITAANVFVFVVARGP